MTAFTAEQVREHAQFLRECIIADANDCTPALRWRHQDKVAAMLAAYADLLEQRASGVTDEVVAKAAHAYLGEHVGFGHGCDLSQLRDALEAVWPIVAEPVAQADIPDPQTCKFYGVSTFPLLVKEMEQHIAKLQAERPKKPWEDTFPPRIG